MAASPRSVNDGPRRHVVALRSIAGLFLSADSAAALPLHARGVAEREIGEVTGLRRGRLDEGNCDLLG